MQNCINFQLRLGSFTSSKTLRKVSSSKEFPHGKSYLRPPELHMFGFQPKQILANLVVNQALADISPGLGRRRVMNHYEHYYEDQHTGRGISPVHLVESIIAIRPKFV